MSLRTPLSSLSVLLVIAACSGDEGAKSGDAATASGDAAPADAAATPPTPEASHHHPLVLFGLDGGDWEAIHKLWEEGELGAFKTICDNGSCGELTSNLGSSPAIWTTVATGVDPEVHGIRDFVTPTDAGDVPVNSTLRKVPAIWNILTDAGRKVSVAGWWATWPAEEINGKMIPDIAQNQLPNRVSPASWEAEFASELMRANNDNSLFPGKENPHPQDRMVTYFGPRLLKEGNDLTMLYVRSTDVASHHGWGYFIDPDRYRADTDQATIDELADKVRRSYTSVNASLQLVLDNLPADTNLIVMSDHGFYILEDDAATKVYINTDAVFKKLGFTTVDETGVNFSKSKVYTFSTPHSSQLKKVRFALEGREAGGTVKEADRQKIYDDLVKALKRVTYSSGKPIFKVDDLKNGKTEVDFTIQILRPGCTTTMLVDGKELPGPIKKIVRHTGGHGGGTEGVFLAMGPDFKKGADLTGIDVRNVPPTMYYSLDMPVAKDFSAGAWLDLFTDEFRADHELKSVPSYGTREVGGAMTTEIDGVIKEQLCELGYIQCD